MTESAAADTSDSEDETVSAAARVFFLYRGEEDIDVPETVTHVRVEEGITTIQEQAFGDCNDLESVEIPMLGGLTHILYRAFSNCWQLKEIQFPSSLLFLGPGSFNECHSLINVSLPEGLKSIEAFAFHDCMNLWVVALPFSLKVIKERAFGQCTALKSIQLPQRLCTIETGAFRGCKSLINICLPMFCELGTDILRDATTLCETFGDTETSAISGLQNRFQGLPLHRLCYYQDIEIFVPMKRAIRKIRLVDSFGMTVFHIMALSSRPWLFLFESLTDLCPELLDQPDKQSNLPIDYLCMADAPEALECIRFVMKVTLVNRLNSWLGLDTWRTKMQDHLDLFLSAANKDERLYRLNDLKRSFAVLLLLEKTSLLELALWKAQLVNLEQDDSPVHRQSCLVNCGADVVIGHVLPYLESPPETRYYN
eukprot:scaffold12118_cov138-Cylindrotheca_fusiformis.AAC.10